MEFLIYTEEGEERFFGALLQVNVCFMEGDGERHRFLETIVYHCTKKAQR